MAGCSSNGNEAPTPPNTTKPTIANLTFDPSTITFKPNTTFFITGTFTFKDAASGVAEMWISSSYGGNLVVPLDPNSATSGTINGLIELLMPEAPGIFTFEVWIVDGKGVSSNKLSGKVSIAVDDNATKWHEASRQYALHRVVWGNGRYVAVGEAGTIAISTDGEYWSPSASGTTATLYGVTWTGSLYVATGTNKTILTSPDGTNWTVRMTEKSGITLYGVASSGTTIVAAGSEYNSRTVEIYTSNDGINWWNTYTEPLAGTINSVRWLGNEFVAVGGYPLILHSSVTGANWIKQTFPGVNGTDELTDIAWNGSKYVAIGYGITAVSANLSIWAASGTNWGAAGITWSGNRFVTAGLDGFKVSTNGVEWSTSCSSIFPLRSIAWSGAQYVAVGFIQPIIMVSP